MGVAGRLLGTVVAMLLYYLLLQLMLLCAGAILYQWQRAVLRTAAAHAGPSQPPPLAESVATAVQSVWLRCWGLGSRVESNSRGDVSGGGGGTGGGTSSDSLSSVASGSGPHQQQQQQQVQAQQQGWDDLGDATAIIDGGCEGVHRLGALLHVGAGPQVVS
jgi:hypothetical protein